MLMFFRKKHHNVKLGLGSKCTTKCEQNHSYPGYDLSPHFDVRLKSDLSPTWLFDKLTLTGTNTLAYYSNFWRKKFCGKIPNYSCETWIAWRCYDILSTCHFFNLLFCQLAILSTCHSSNPQRKFILPNLHIKHGSLTERESSIPLTSSSR